ncbi:MAG: hypothetical protein U1B83_03120 [Candidatus Cloacimonadaceae bacterium]|nr:hypothetical protein [Candidatus Cloacimonadaceae bacterium]
MAKTLLNLKLSYKGKLLDIVKYGNDFKSKWFIGSSKHLFWQILDPSFPDRHLFVTQKGNDLYMNLIPGAKLSCSKDGNPVETSYLQSNGILSGTQLKLRNDMTGVLVLNPDWEIKYEYSEPWVKLLTEEERQIVAQYSRRGELTSVERFNRGMIVLFTIITLLFVIIYDVALKPETIEDTTLEMRLAQIQKAQRIEAQLPMAQQASFGDDAAARARAEAAARAAAEAAAAAAAAAAAGQRGTTTGPAGGTGDASRTFGSFSPSATGVAQPFQAVTTTQSFVAATPGGRGGGGGAGGGPGGGPGAGSGYASTFDPGATGGYNQTDLGSVAFGTPGGPGSSTRPGDNVAVFTGDATKIAPRGRPVAQTAETQRVIQSFQAAAIQPISEGAITAAPEEQRPDLEKIQIGVNGRKGQIMQLYRASAAVKAASGSIQIKLYIDNNGNVTAADVTPTSEGFTEKFLKDVKNLVEGWSFNVSNKAIYQFTVRLTQG